MENKLEISKPMQSRAPVRSADTAVVRAIRHEDEVRHGMDNPTRTNKPAVRRNGGSSHAQAPARNRAQAAERAHARTSARETEEVQEKTREKSRVLPLALMFVVSALILLLYLGIGVYRTETDKINRFVIVECGSPVTEAMFFNDTLSYPDTEDCNLDFSSVRIDVPQTIHFTITYLFTDMECVLEIADSMPPTGVGIPQKLFAVDKLPDVNECVKDIKDRTDVTLKWGKIPDYSKGGEFKAEALLTDAVGNTASVMVPLSVTCDDTPPVITGAKDISAFTGTSITYREGISVTDDYDKNPTLTIDTSKVDMNKPGVYKVIYTATDFSGNKATAEIQVDITKKPKSYVEQADVDKVAQKILDKITKPDMTQKEKALQIVWWCRYNINYIAKADSTSRNRAAYDALTKRTATCYGYACAVREMLNLCGIENMFIKRYPWRHSIHYWNYIKIDGEWYHCDSTPRKGYNSYFFMYTSTEIQNFHHSGWYGYVFKVKEYPASATKSVQKTIDYANHKVKK